MGRRRTRNAGVDPEYISSLGIPAWEPERRASTGYVGGRYSDEGPLTALLWSDLRRAYSALHIPHVDATMFELHMAGLSLRRIAQLFGLAPDTVRLHIHATRLRLESYPRLGILTVIVEQCGGWRAAADLMF